MSLSADAGARMGLSGGFDRERIGAKAWTLLLMQGGIHGSGAAVPLRFRRGKAATLGAAPWGRETGRRRLSKPFSTARPRPSRARRSRWHLAATWSPCG